MTDRGKKHVCATVAVALLVCVVAAVLFVRAGDSGELAFSLKEVPVFDLPENGRRQFLMGHRTACGGADPNVTAYPAFRSGEPIYGEVDFSEPLGENLAGNVVAFMLIAGAIGGLWAFLIGLPFGNGWPVPARRGDPIGRMGPIGRIGPMLPASGRQDLSYRSHPSHPSHSFDRSDSSDWVLSHPGAPGCPPVGFPRQPKRDRLAERCLGARHRRTANQNSLERRRILA